MSGGHTKGPWAFGPNYTPGDHTFDLFGPGGRQVIASASYENMWLAAYDKVTDAANARLIAAAPCVVGTGAFLLDRLADFENRISTDEDAREFHGHVAPAIANFRAAISRATGEQGK